MHFLHFKKRGKIQRRGKTSTGSNNPFSRIYSTGAKIQKLHVVRPFDQNPTTRGYFDNSPKGSVHQNSRPAQFEIYLSHFAQKVLASEFFKNPIFPTRPSGKLIRHERAKNFKIQKWNKNRAVAAKPKIYHPRPLLSFENPGKFLKKWNFIFIFIPDPCLKKQKISLIFRKQRSWAIFSENEIF